MFSLICVWINGWVNNREAGDLRRYRTHYDVNVMQQTPHTSPLQMSYGVSFVKIFGEKRLCHKEVWLYICSEIQNVDLTSYFTLCILVLMLNLYFDGFVQDCSISIVNALEILQSCTKPSICFAPNSVIGVYHQFKLVVWILVWVCYMNVCGMVSSFQLWIRGLLFIISL